MDMIDQGDSNATCSRNTDDAKYVRLHEKLKPRLGRGRAHRTRNDSRARDQKPSPLRYGLSSTPETEIMHTDDGESSQELNTSLDLLAKQEPKSCYYKIALQKLLRHCIVHRLSGSGSSLLIDISHRLRDAGASESKVDIVVQHFRAAALPSLSAMLADLLEDDSQLAQLTSAVRERMQDLRASQYAAPHHQEDSTLPNMDSRGSTVPSHKRRRLGESVSTPGAALEQSNFTSVRAFDFELFKTLDPAQRQLLATKAFSTPLELYFYHVRRSCEQVDSGQASVVWSKLAETQVQQWLDLLERLHGGDIDAADTTAGAALLQEHDIISRIECPQSQTIPFRGLEKSEAETERGKGKAAQRLQSEEEDEVTVRSPFF